MDGFVGVSDINLRICLEIDKDTIINLFFVNNYFNKLLHNYHFWVDKFKHDNIKLRKQPVVVYELIKEYQKIYHCYDVGT